MKVGRLLLIHTLAHRYRCNNSLPEQFSTTFLIEKPPLPKNALFSHNINTLRLRSFISVVWKRR